jgi:hypothetical protein
MSRFTYTFIKGEKEIEAEGYNLWNGAANAGLTITRADKLGTHYLQSTPFDERERTVWVAGEYGGASTYTVKQRKNGLN